MAPRRRCPTCGSKQWHKEPSSGLIACSEGHVLQNYRNETTEVEEMGPHAMMKRTVKSKRKRKAAMSRADPKLYHGARGRYHYFLCLQLIFRKQVAVLTRLWELPPEFEIICRDLWALHLSLLPDPPPDEPYAFAQNHLFQGDESVDKEVPPRESQSKYTDKDDKGNEGDKGEDNKSEGDKDEDGRSEDLEDEEDKDENKDEDGKDEDDQDYADSEMDEMMRENSEISSSSDEGDFGAGRTPAVRKRTNNGRPAVESTMSTIAVLIVACWTLRIPVLYRDFTRIIESYELPYLDPLRLLPPNMVCRLTKQMVRSLSPYHAPGTRRVHSIASRLGKLMYSVYGIYTPEANAAPMLWRVVRALGGTPVLYVLTKRLAQILALPLTLHSSLAPQLVRTRARGPFAHKYDNAPPEVSLMAACIVVLKMVYGLDGKTRVPRSADDPGCALPRIDEYLRVVREMKGGDARKREAVFSSRNAMAVGDAGEEELDCYLAFCEKALLGKESEDSVLNSYFPLRSAEPSGGGEEEDQGRGRLAATVAAKEGGGGALRPGEEYTLWHWRDVLGTCAEEYEEVAGRGGTWVGVSQQYLSRVVETLEHRVVRWWEVQKRRTREEEESDEGGSVVREDGMTSA